MLFSYTSHFFGNQLPLIICKSEDNGMEAESLFPY